MSFTIATYLFKLQLSKIELERFQNMLDNDISFISFFSRKMPSGEVVKTTLKKFKIDTSRIDMNYVLTCLAESNPEAYNLVLSHPKGSSWLSRTLEELRQMYL